MLRTTLTAGLIGLLCGSPLLGQGIGDSRGSVRNVPNAGRAPRTAPPVRRAAPSRVAISRSPVLEVLSKRVELVEWDDASFESVIEWLEEQGPINVIVVWRALEAEGIDRDSPVSLTMRNATVSQILKETLDQVADVNSELRYRGTGSTIKISTRQDLNRRLYVRAYDVTDLVFQVPDFKGPTVDVTGGGGGGGAGGGVGGGGLGGGGLGGGGFGGGGIGGGGFGGGGFGGGGFGGGGFGGGGIGGGLGAQNPFSGGGEEEEEDEKSLEERMDELVELIRNTIEPNDWAENGGRNTIRAWNRMIVVRAPIEVHEQLGGPFILPE